MVAVVAALTLAILFPLIGFPVVVIALIVSIAILADFAYLIYGVIREDRD